MAVFPLRPPAWAEGENFISAVSLFKIESIMSSLPGFCCFVEISQKL